MKITHDIFIERMKNVTNKIEITETYVNMNSLISCKCSMCGNSWSATPAHLLNGRGCPECAKEVRAIRLRKTPEDFIKDLKKVNPDIEPLSTYLNSSTYIDCRCSVCGNVWRAKPGNLLSGRGCNKCANKLRGMKYRKSQELFVSQVASANDMVEVVGKYITNKKPIQCRCKKCGYVWYGSPKRLITGSGCPICSMTKGEKRIANYLSLNGIEYIYEKEYDGLVGMADGNLSYDFFIPTSNMLIEYQGQFHDPTWNNSSRTDDDIEKQLEHDRRKRNYAKCNDIRLLEIWYWDFDNIESILEKELLR